MKIEKITKPAFTVIGRQGSTKDGEGFIARLWQEANARFAEIEPYVKRDENGVPVGFWGAMSDFSLSFQPWENGFSEPDSEKLCAMADLFGISLDTLVRARGKNEEIAYVAVDGGGTKTDFLLFSADQV